MAQQTVREIISAVEKEIPRTDNLMQVGTTRFSSRIDALPGEIKNELTANFSRWTKKDPVLAEILELSLASSTPTLSFSEKFESRLDKLDIPAYEIRVACLDYFKRLRNAKRAIVSRIGTTKFSIRGRKISVGKVFLYAAALTIGAGVAYFISPLMLIDNEFLKILIDHGIGLTTAGVVIENGWPGH